MGAKPNEFLQIEMSAVMLQILQDLLDTATFKEIIVSQLDQNIEQHKSTSQTRSNNMPDRESRCVIIVIFEGV